MTDAQPLDRRVNSLEKDLLSVVELLGAVTGAVDDLTEKVDTAGGTPKKDPGPSRWAWRHADQDQAAWLWAGLIPWVRRLTDRYPGALRDLPPCWHLHGDAVEELTRTLGGGDHADVHLGEPGVDESALERAWSSETEWARLSGQRRRQLCPAPDD